MNARLFREKEELHRQVQSLQKVSGMPPQESFCTPQKKATYMGPNMFFPMWLLPVKELLGSTDSLPYHQQLRERNLIRRWVPGMYCIFVSHQWTSHNFADPTGQQVKVLRRALQNIIDGTIAVETHLLDRLPNRERDRMDEDVRKSIENGLIWFDWVSVPQTSVASSHLNQHLYEDVKKDMISAVRSIPGYVQACNLLLVLCPSVRHQDTGQTCDLASWKSRGWCRVELSCKELATSATQHAVVIRSDQQAYYMRGADWMFAPPGEGEFTDQSDKDIIYPVMAAAVDRKILHLQGLGNAEWEMGFLMTLRDRMLSGLPKPDGAIEFVRFRSHDSHRGARISMISNAQVELPIHDEDLGDDVGKGFLSRYGFSSLMDHRPSGWDPILWAAAEGNLDMVDKILKLGVDVNSRALEGKPHFSLAKGHYPLTVAAYLHGDFAVLQRLLDARAKVDATEGNGFSALMAASLGDRHRAVQQLVSNKASLEQCTGALIGRRALHCAALTGAVRSAKVLLSSRADPNARNHFGRTPLMLTAMETGNVFLANQLLSHRACVNLRALPSTPEMQNACHLARSLTSFGAKSLSFSSQLLMINTGNSALGFAAFAGHGDLCHLLLEYSANVHNKDFTGRTPSDMAALGAHYELSGALSRIASSSQSQQSSLTTKSTKKGA